MKPRPPLSQIIIYALGQFGWALAAFGADNLLVYFYMPPESAEQQISTVFIHQGAIFGLIAVLGIINSSSRIFDAITDPIIANLSDKSDAGMGKRKYFMAIASIPFALLSFFIFYPLFTGIIHNTICLGVMVFLFYFFMTLYVVPYTALISELGHHPDDRMKISTIISVSWAMGFVLGNTAYGLQAYFESFMTSVQAFQMAMGIFAVVSLIFMLIPVFFLNEKKYCVQQVSTISVKTSLASVFKNTNFRYFIFSDLMYWSALTFIQLGTGFYITILMGMDKEYGSLFAMIGFFCSFLLYIPINFLVKKYGEKSLILMAFVVFGIIYGLVFGMNYLPIPKMAIFYTLALLSAFPLATFGIIPNAITADIIHEHEARTGEQQAGMFYAARAFMMKLGKSLANLIFPSLLLLGKSVDNPLGIKLSALAALIFCTIGFLLFFKYKDVGEGVEQVYES